MLPSDVKSFHYKSTLGGNRSSAFFRCGDSFSSFERAFIHLFEAGRLCPRCGSIERTRKIQVFQFKTTNTWYEETLLKKEVFGQVCHSKEHEANSAIIEQFECSIDLTKGYQMSGWGNYWSIDKANIWAVGAPEPGCQDWTNRLPIGFCLHEDAEFVGAFKRLALTDPVWSKLQLGTIGSLLSRRKFPGSLVQFATNRNEEAIFKHLQTISLGRADFSSHWERDYRDYPLGSTNQRSMYRLR
jgi:hypothetical protein